MAVGEIVFDEANREWHRGLDMDVRDIFARSGMRSAIRPAGYIVRQVRPPRGKTWPMKTIMGQKAGVFLVAYIAGQDAKKVGHCVMIDCRRRIVACNHLGVMPFRMENAKESEATHEELKGKLCVCNITMVWRVLEGSKKRSKKQSQKRQRCV